ncbi:MAG: hypothetical protein NW205_04850 [Hyphomicrobiaceae bacterium]|nr:hypothetical protein [Hyphomicrobiaceae bacterium]
MGYSILKVAALIAGLATVAIVPAEAAPLGVAVAAEAIVADAPSLIQKTGVRVRVYVGPRYRHYGYRSYRYRYYRPRYYRYRCYRPHRYARKRCYRVRRYY